MYITQNFASKLVLVRGLLRREDKVPAIVYGANKEATSITLEHKDVIKAQESEGFLHAKFLTLTLAASLLKLS